MGTRVLLAVVALLVLFGAVQAAEYVRRLYSPVDSSLWPASQMRASHPPLPVGRYDLIMTGKHPSTTTAAGSPDCTDPSAGELTAIDNECTAAGTAEGASTTWGTQWFATDDNPPSSSPDITHCGMQKLIKLCEAKCEAQAGCIAIWVFTSTRACGHLCGVSNPLASTAPQRR